MKNRFDLRQFPICSVATLMCAAMMLNSRVALAAREVGKSEVNAEAVPTIGLSVAASQITLQKTAGVTCARTPVSALRLDLGQTKLTWQNTSALQSGAIVVAFESPYIKGSQYICEIDNAEFDAVFGTQGATVGASVTSVSGCNLQCGGIEVVAGAPAFAALGTVSIFGTTQVGGVNRVQQRATTPIMINYVP